MKLLKSFVCIFIPVLCTACATHPRTKFSMTSDLEEQCKILNKKRMTLNQKPKFRGKVSRVSKIIISPAKPLAVKIEQSESEQIVSLNVAEVDVTPTQTSLPVSQENTTSELVNNKSRKVKISTGSSETVTEEELTSITSHKTKKTAVAYSPEEEHLYLLGVSAITAIALLSLSRSRARRISTWAAKNPWKTRAIITGIHFVTAASAWWIGYEFANNQIAIAESSSHAAMIAFTTAVILYPIRSSATAYLKRKACDIVLFSCGIALFVYIGNLHALGQQKSQQDSAFEMHADTNPTETTKFKVAGKDVFQKIILTILAIGVTIGLFYLLAILSCSIYCSTSIVVALPVAIAGIIGIGRLFNLMMRSIFKKAGQEKPEKVEVQKI